MSLLDGATEVTHWLARHDGGDPKAAGLAGTGPRAGAPTAVAPTPPGTRVPGPGAPRRGPGADTGTAPPGAAPPPGAGREGPALLLTPADVAAWARATGDRNALHLLPGAAARAGLGAGETEIVAHGTLLAALSLAVAPARRADLRLVAPAVVPPEGLRLRLAPDGDVLSEGDVLLRRR
ncbi:MaoC/PaaZ C-terminal domain-containing protein [Actinomyces sp. 217892]|uniref:MaoC/PaaZ C-terminal domain-containing protein n=1 Tax=Actinomyces sp. 217892 TaxID=2927827 RepID=UPI00201751EA